MAADTPQTDLKRQVAELERRLAETRDELAAIKNQQAAVAPGAIEALGLDTKSGRRQALKYAGGAATLPALLAYGASEQGQADAVAADVGTEADPWQKVWTHEIESGDGASEISIPDAVSIDEVNISNVGARGYLSTNQSIPSGSTTQVAFDAEAYDDENEFDVSTGTFTASDAGTYLVTTQYRSDSQVTSSGSQAFLLIHVNGVSKSQTVFEFDQSEYAVDKAATVVKLSAGDSVTVHVNQDTGSPFTLDGREQWTHITVSKLG